jgi:pyruvate formate lyase activating enzyme
VNSGSDCLVVFGGVQKVSLIDYPDNVAMVFFTVGCNLRCPFCHNPDLIFNPPNTFNEEYALNLINERKELINSVVITGGEPTLHKDLPLFIKKIKKLNLKVKLDTNGLSPSVLEECIKDVDYVAMDIKTSLKKYNLVGCDNTELIKQSIEIIMNKAKDYEFRATLAPGIINLEDLKEVGELVKGAKKFYLQQFRQGDNLDKEFNPTPYTFEQIDLFKEILSHYVEKVELRI